MHLNIQEAVRAALEQRYVPSDFLTTEVVFLLGARLVFDFSSGRWRSATFHDNFDQMPDLKDAQARKRTPPLSCLRVEATKFLIKQRPNVVVIVSGRSSDPTRRPSSAEVMAAELGPILNTIILDKSAVNTWGHFNYLATGCPKDLANVTMITNAYHVPRTSVMLDQAKKQMTALNRLTINVIAAEAVIKSFNPDAGPKIDRAYLDNPFVQAFIGSEAQGIERLKKGVYQLT